MLTQTKSFLKKMAGERNLGRWDYFLKPQLADSWGGAFNGQIHRQRIFLDIIERLPIKAIVETGTYLGTTTAFLAKVGVPVYTVESNPRFHAYAAMRFYRQRDRIHVCEGNSVAFLKALAELQDFPKTDVFFYLDAHWEEHLPLREELEIIFARWRDAIVMVDDFQVPGTDYGFDDYGPGKALTPEYLKPLQHLKLSTLFPAIGAEGETGKKRGCVVLCKDDSTKNMFSGVQLLAARS